MIACVVGSVVSNNAAALLLYPIVVDLSNEVAELDRRQAVLVLMVASSASFLTPVRIKPPRSCRHERVRLPESPSFLMSRCCLTGWLILLCGCACAKISYQTNLMVMGPGRYEFLDFLRFGLGLQCVAMASIVLVGHLQSEAVGLWTG